MRRLRSGARRNHQRDRALKAIALMHEERAALIAFLESLADEAFISNERLAAPGA